MLKAVISIIPSLIGTTLLINNLEYTLVNSLLNVEDVKKVVIISVTLIDTGQDRKLQITTFWDMNRFNDAAQQHLLLQSIAGRNVQIDTVKSFKLSFFMKYEG